MVGFYYAPKILRPRGIMSDYFYSLEMLIGGYFEDYEWQILDEIANEENQ